MKKQNFWEKYKRQAKASLKTWYAGEPPEKALLEWKAPEFYLVEKSIVWGVVLALFFVVLAGLMIYLGQALTGLVVLLSMVVFLKLAYAKPEELDYRIEPDGVRVSGWLHPYYQDIVSYWTAGSGKRTFLYLKTRNIFTDRLAIPLEGVSAKQAAKALDKFLPEQLPPSVPKVAKSHKKHSKSSKKK